MARARSLFTAALYTEQRMESPASTATRSRRLRLRCAARRRGAKRSAL